MAAVTICSDFGAQGNKVCHCFHCFPIYLPWSDGTGCHDLSFLMLTFKSAFSLFSSIVSSVSNTQCVLLEKQHEWMLSCFSHVRLCATLWTADCQASLSMGFFRQECWSGWPCPSLEDLPDPEIEPKFLTIPALAGRFFAGWTTRETLKPPLQLPKDFRWHIDKHFLLY